jgi:hypothetical protein
MPRRRIPSARRGFLLEGIAMLHDLTTADPAFDIKGDELKGGAAIAAFLGTSKPIAYRMMARNILPHWKRGGTVVASKRALVAHYQRQTSGQTA